MPPRYVSDLKGFSIDLYWVLQGATQSEREGLALDFEIDPEILEAVEAAIKDRAVKVYDTEGRHLRTPKGYPLFRVHSTREETLVVFMKYPIQFYFDIG